MKYKGAYLGTINAKHVKLRKWWGGGCRGCGRGMRSYGGIQPIDLGKQLWLQNGTIFIENNEQRDDRLARSKP